MNYFCPLRLQRRFLAVFITNQIPRREINKKQHTKRLGGQAWQREEEPHPVMKLKYSYSKSSV